MARQMLMGRRRTAAKSEPEAEPVVVDTDHDNLVVLQLDDGSEIELDERELRTTLEAA